MKKKLEGKLILIVDDEKDLQEIISEELRDAGARTICCDGGYKALEIFKNTPKIDAIVSDVKMPAGDGFELLKGIRNSAALMPVVLMVTGFSDYSQEQFYEQGACGILNKPCNFDDLINILVKFLTPRLERYVRKYDRHEINFNVTIKLDSLEKAIETHCINIGRGGMYIASQGPLPAVNEKVSFNITFKNNDTIFELDGTAHCRWVRDTNISTNPAGFGVQFESLSESAFETIESLLKLKPTNSQIPVK